MARKKKTHQQQLAEEEWARYKSAKPMTEEQILVRAASEDGTMSRCKRQIKDLNATKKEADERLRTLLSAQRRHVHVYQLRDGGVTTEHPPMAYELHPDHPDYSGSGTLNLDSI